MHIQLHIWQPDVVGTLQEGGGHIWLEKQEDPQGSSDPREGQQASERACCMLLSGLSPVLSTRGCPGDMALPRNHYQQPLAHIRALPWGTLIPRPSPVSLEQMR